MNWTIGTITLTPYEIGALFVFGWIVVSALAARLSGWKELARSYRNQQPFRGKLWRFQSARLRFGTGYNNCLTIGADEQGLYLSILPPFAFGHPPLLIPWGELTGKNKKTLMMSMVELHAAQAPGVQVEIMEQLAKKINEAFPNRIKII